LAHRSYWLLSNTLFANEKFKLTHYPISDAADRPDLVVLIFAVGGTEIGIGVPREMLAQVGASLTTISASGKAN
jgi:hypothetical protein